MIEDNKAFQEKFGFDKEEFTEDKMLFRNDLLAEEFFEIQKSITEQNAEEWVDGHVDIIVIALGNLQLAGVDPQKAWDQVVRANMSKERGIKPGREQSGGFDVIKPEGWVGPDHSDNHGVLDGIFEKS